MIHRSSHHERNKTFDDDVASSDMISGEKGQPKGNKSKCLFGFALVKGCSHIINVGEKRQAKVWVKTVFLLSLVTMLIIGTPSLRMYHGDIYIVNDEQFAKGEVASINIVKMLPTNSIVSRVQQSKHLLHPFAVARFPNGTTGFVIDPAAQMHPDQTLLRRRNQICHPDRGSIDRQAHKVFSNIRATMIKSKLQNGKMDSTIRSFNEMKTSSTDSSNKSNRSPRIFCMVYTHSEAHHNIEAIANTWGKQCNGFFASSNATDLSMNTIDLSHLGPESYGNMWQKVRSMWAYAYDHFLDDYDYFHICGDDTFVLVDNMKAYLQGEQVLRLLNGFIDNIAAQFKDAKRWEKLEQGEERPLLLGFPAHFKRKMFPVGGSGYTLNRAALRLLAEEGGPLDMLFTDLEDSREDVLIADLLLSLGVVISDTRDDKGAFRYLRHNPARVIITKFPPQFNIPPTRGIDNFSDETVAIHLKGMDRNERMDEVIYRTNDIFSGNCDNKMFK